MTLRLPLSENAYATMISVYAPTMTNQDENKKAFYQQLDEVRLEQVDFTKGQTEENWAKLRNEVDTAAKETIDAFKRHHQDWFDDNDSVIRSLLAEKYAAHKNWLADIQSDSRRDKFHNLRREVQKRLRSMKDEWWKKKADEIQDYADSKNAKLFYSSLREVYGPPQRSASPIRNLQGELLTDNEAINRRWSEHFEQLLNRPSSIDPSVPRKEGQLT
ncbi:hypothetical protein ACOMHN_040771 [Nucella lapillus]